MKSIIIIIDYFGKKWPEWFDIFMLTCKRNSTINWLINTDCEIPEEFPDNIEFQKIEFENYITLISNRLSIKFNPENYYKLCDIRPMLGHIHKDKIKSYCFWGYGDLDVLYGNIRYFYDYRILENNVISTHNWCLSGHLALLKNNEKYIYAFQKIKNWKRIVQKPYNQRFDEDIFSKLFIFPEFYNKSRVLKLVYNLFHANSRLLKRKTYFVEQNTTPLVPGMWKGKLDEHPVVWFWKDGKIYNESDKDQEFIYLHFMNFKNGRYMDPKYGNKAPWEGKNKLIHGNINNLKDEIRIDFEGIHVL